MRHRSIRFALLPLVLAIAIASFGSVSTAMSAPAPVPVRANEHIAGLPASITGPSTGTHGQEMTYIVRTTNISDTLVMKSTFGLFVMSLEANAPCTLQDGGTATRISCAATLYRFTIRSDWGQRITMSLQGVFKDVGIDGEPQPYLDTRVFLHGADQNLLVGETGNYEITAVNQTTQTLTYTMDLVVLSGIPRHAALQVTKNPLGCNVVIGFDEYVLHCEWVVEPDHIEQRDLDIKWTFPGLHTLQIYGAVDGVSIGTHTRRFGIVQIGELPAEPYADFIPLVRHA
ncbi:MAG: hypothetical protein RI947_638 [Candidatus Parcubacteria bacterium]